MSCKCAQLPHISRSVLHFSNMICTQASGLHPSVRFCTYVCVTRCTQVVAALRAGQLLIGVGMSRSSKGQQAADVTLPSIASQLWRHAMQQQPLGVRCGVLVPTLLFCRLNIVTVCHDLLCCLSTGACRREWPGVFALIPVHPLASRSYSFAGQ